MASSTYWRCLARPGNTNRIVSRSSQFQAPGPSSTAAFSASATVHRMRLVVRKPAGPSGQRPEAPKRGTKSTFTKKKKKRDKNESKARLPAVGERKALRKRVVLSNPNAIEVETTRLGEETVINEDLKGKILSLPSALIDQLKALEAFEARQSWGMFKRPSILVRDDTLELAKLFSKPESSTEPEEPAESAEPSEPSERRQETLRRIIVGARGTGKTVYLLQAMALALHNHWTVIHLPEARDLTSAHTDYNPIPGSKPTQYNQKRYISSLLQRIARANPHLASLRLGTTPTLPVPVQENMSLDRFCALGADPEIAYQVFLAVWAELTLPGRPPVLLTMENFARANEFSDYMSSAFKRIHAHDLFLVNWFVEHISGKKSLPNGGAVFAAVSQSNCGKNPTVDIRLRQIEARQKLREGTLRPEKDLTVPFLEATGQKANPIPAADPFYKYDPRVLDVFGGREAALQGSADATPIEVKRVEPVNREEARTLMEYWAMSGMIRAQIDDRYVGQKWTLSGGGILSELERGCFGMKI